MSETEAGARGRLKSLLSCWHLLLPAVLLLLGVRAWQAGDAHAAAEMAPAPSAVAAHFDDGHTHGLGSSAQGLAGTERDITGFVSVVWGDAQDGSGTEPIFFIHLDDGTQIPAVASSGDVALGLAKGPFGSQTFRVVDLPADSTAPAPGLPAPKLSILSATPSAGSPAPGPVPVTGSHPWVTVMCKFSDYAGEPWTPGAVNTLMVNSASAPGLDFYWRQVSYGTFNIAGSVVAGNTWFTLPSPRSAYASGGQLLFQKLVDDCTGAANASVNFAAFSGVNMMFNANLDINGAINAAWGGSANVAADSAGLKRMTWMPTWADQAVIGHETGHGFGLSHSWSGYGVSYGSKWDVMSSYGTCIYTDPTWGCFPVHTIAEYKDTLGVLPPASKFTPALNSKQIVQLAQLDTFDGSAGTYMMIRVPSLGGAGGSGFDYYTMELRRLNGPYDRNTPAGPTGAVVIHEVLSTRTAIYGSHPAKVVDLENDGDAADCNSVSFCSDVPNDARWVAGEVFWDQANQIMFKVIDLGSNGVPATVAIRYGNPPLSSLSIGFDQQPPYVAGSGVAFSAQPRLSVRDTDTLPNTNDDTSVITLSVEGGGATLSCTGGQSKAVTDGVAAFSGCSLTGPAGSYQLKATSPGLPDTLSIVIQLESTLDCTAGTCAFDFASGLQGFELTGLWHRETLAVPTGLSGPNLAFNQGCTGAGLTGCNYDAGGQSGVAFSPFMNLGAARLLTFKSVRVTGDTICSGLDATSVWYTTDGNTWNALELGQRAGVSSGGQYAPWGVTGQICGNSSSAQSISVIVPAGTVQVLFYFAPNGGLNNSTAGWFIDDVSFTVPSAASQIWFYAANPGQWFLSVPFPSSAQPMMSIRTNTGAELWEDNTTQVTLGLLQNGAAIASLEAAESPGAPGAAPTPGSAAPLPSASAPAVPDPAPPPGTLTCATPLTLTVTAGRAQFLGCQVNSIGYGYNWMFSAPNIGAWYIVTPFDIVIPWNCDAGECDNTFDSQPGYGFSNLGHWETYAQVTGMTSPMVAINFGCTGLAKAGCSYDTGNTNGSGFQLPLLILSNANRLEFSISKDTSPGSTCGYADDFLVYTTTDRLSWQAINLYQDATISAGPLHFDSSMVYGVCGSGSGTQRISVKLPAGTIGVWFWFWPGDTVDNARPGIFVDDVDFTSSATSLAFVQQPPGNVTTGSPFGFSIAVKDGLGQTVAGDDSTIIDVQLIGAGTITCPGGLQKQVVSGVAVFTDCTLDAAGPHNLWATSSPFFDPVASTPFSTTAAGGTTWYFAEGFTGNGWETYLYLLNSTTATANVDVKYFRASGLPVIKSVQIPPQSRKTLFANDPAQGPGPNQAFGITVESDQPITAQQSLIDTVGQLAHGSVGSQVLSQTWYFAEGFSGNGWLTFISATNPTASTANVALTYHLTNGSSVVRNQSVAAFSRYTFAGHVDVPGQAFSVSLTSDVGVVAQEVLIDTVGLLAHGTIGSTTTAQVWQLAEGFTGDSWLTFISVGNLGASSATVTATYNVLGEAPVQRQIVVPPGSRNTFAAHELATGVGPGKSFGVTITSDQPVVVQEVLIDPKPGVALAHGVLASTSLNDEFTFGGGTSEAGWLTFVSVTNPSGLAVSATATYFFEGGAPALSRTIAVPANSRVTFASFDGLTGVAPGQRFGVRVTATGNVISQEVVIDVARYLAYSAAGTVMP